MQASSFGLCDIRGCRGLKARAQALALRWSFCAITFGPTKLLQRTIGSVGSPFIKPRHAVPSSDWLQRRVGSYWWTRHSRAFQNSATRFPALRCGYTGPGTGNAARGFKRVGPSLANPEKMVQLSIRRILLSQV